MSTERRGDSILKRLHISRVVLSVILVGACATATYFSVRYYTLSQQQSAKISQLERTMNELSSQMNIDSIRQYSIKKVIAIIDLFNPQMESSQKYEIANTIYEMSLKYRNLDIDLICATITHESAKTWNPQVVSHVGAMGLMQIMPNTGMYLASYEGLNWTSSEQVLFDPVNNIRLGCRYLSSLIAEYSLDGGLAAYNGGPRMAAKWIKQNYAQGVLWEETANYIPSVRKIYEQYRLMTM